ncbi:ATP-binding cassette domain-containing protein [Streptomyces sp. NBC_00842]|uniref:ATP-binding cassette domain-containing protein n=1 Tax=Streptomyces sp. NBC_00842 TaxID=2975848 RepID=UPI0038684CBE|nr:ATP-binding cassette domain-containing protein [Streptomyces sp. NBC_00842]
MPTAQLSLHNITRRYDDHIVLNEVSFTVGAGEKAGIIGDNGAGKSTLLRLVSGQDRPDNGELTVVSPGGIGHLAQSLALPPEADVQDAVNLALAELRDLESRMRRAEAGLKNLAGAELAAALDAYSRLVARYEARDGYRLLVTGPNGAGKTTLMRVLAGELRPDDETVRTTGRVGHLRQEETPWPPGLTVPQAFAHNRAGDLDEHTDALLSLGLFRPDDLRLRVGELSYGQRRRIELARLVSDPVDLLLLDEPTNHLSPALAEELEGALAGYPGAVVVVTHDRRMRDRFTGNHLELSAGRITQHRSLAATEQAAPARSSIHPPTRS